MGRSERTRAPVAAAAFVRDAGDRPMTATVCDRCDGRIEEPQERDRNYVRLTRYNGGALDLCDACRADLRDWWLRQGRHEEASDE